jgi:hypothetical protein
MIKGILLGNIAVDCAAPERLRNFYAYLTGWERRELWDCHALVDESGMICILFMGADFDYIAPIWPEEIGKQQKQMHFDFQVDDLTTAVEEAIMLGATKPEQQYGGDDFMTLLDPEGHPFCLCKK